MSDMAARNIEKKPGGLRRRGTAGGAGCGSM